MIKRNHGEQAEATEDTLLVNSSTYDVQPLNSCDIWGYLDSRLLAELSEEERQILKKHVKTCPPCAVRFEEYQIIEGFAPHLPQFALVNHKRKLTWLRWSGSRQMPWTPDVSSIMVSHLGSRSLAYLSFRIGAMADEVVALTKHHAIKLLLILALLLALLGGLALNKIDPEASRVTPVQHLQACGQYPFPPCN